ncbi:ATP-dependent DNA helicase pif1 [Eumeta japonica]|uniref:ATP-dependent DNA helicase n=2 Tax=Eumeta variegata TaxID=151549 RepID=A0A4C1YBN9_EUMVA|nr:ATP-dependent DNA helicase pif1 [Eumeta japonica]
MTTICRYCNALKFKRETAGCASGKVKLDPLLTPPQPLKTLFDGSDPDSSHFLQHILEYNNCFRMTSFGANIIREGGFMPTCKIQGQIYHLHGSMVPTPDEPHQFLQIYFISSMVDQLNVRCNIQGAQQLKRRIIEQLQAFFTLIMLWARRIRHHVEDGRSITGVSTNKNLSAMNYYAYRMMIRTHEENVILKCRRLFQQFAVDMYVKVETERLAFIRFNQAKLRSEDYIHLRDAIHSDGDVQNIGRLTILPSTYIGSPRHMHEYAQDAMTYVRNYGTPDLFITVTCNPKWTEIERELEPGQKPQDRHDIIARVFQQKLKVMMDVLTKYRVLVTHVVICTRWNGRSVEPHAHILILLLNKLHSNEVDDIISAEIPDPVTDPRLHDIVTTQMVHGPCGALNPLSPCMADGKCTKRYPRPLVAETVTGTMDIQFIVGVQRKITVELSKLKFKIKRLRSEMNSLYHIARCYHEFSKHMQTLRVVIRPNQSNICATVHLENGQRVYFTEANAAQRAERPPSTTLTSFFAMCEADPFAATLMYVEMPKYYTWNQSTKKFQRRKQGTPVPDWPQVFSTDALGPKQVYETLMQAVDNNTGGLFFLDAPGGTGKTFVISLILATIRSRCDIALALASSGIAATLLDGGRTAHSALKLPLNLNTIDTPTCNISRSSAMGKLLMQCKLIVWDECTMAHKKSLEALNFTLKDLRRNNNIFGGLMILLAGDFRQTLPVVPVERLQMN